MNGWMVKSGCLPEFELHLGARVPWCFPVSPSLPRRDAKRPRWVASPLHHVDAHDVVVALLDSSHNALVEGEPAVQRQVSGGSGVGAGHLPLWK